jgi:hypothetical protein
MGLKVRRELEAVLGIMLSFVPQSDCPYYHNSLSGPGLYVPKKPSHAPADSAWVHNQVANRPVL